MWQRELVEALNANANADFAFNALDDGSPSFDVDICAFMYGNEGIFLGGGGGQRDNAKTSAIFL